MLATMRARMNIVEISKIRPPSDALSMLVKSTGTTSDKNNHVASHTDAPDRQIREQANKNRRMGAVKEDQRAVTQTALVPPASKIPTPTSENISYIY